MRILGPDCVCDVVDRALIHRISNLDDHDRIVLGARKRNVGCKSPGNERYESNQKEAAHNESVPRTVDRWPQTEERGDRYSPPMPTVLLVADRQSVIDQVHASLAATDIVLIDHPDSDTAAAAAYGQSVDGVLVDMQVGSMGAMAVARDVRAKADDGDEIPVTILLDRPVDAFLAGRSGAGNWLLKDAPASELEAALARAPATPS